MVLIELTDLFQSGLWKNMERLSRTIPHIRLYKTLRYPWETNCSIFSAFLSGLGVVCAHQKWVVCARQKLLVCARYFCVILSLYLCNMILLVDASSLRHHMTHHCVGGFPHITVCFLFLGLHSLPSPPPSPSFFLSLSFATP